MNQIVSSISRHGLPVAGLLLALAGAASCEGPPLELAPPGGSAPQVEQVQHALKAACPAGTFKTTGQWRGCKCASGHKEYLDIFSYQARCEGGPSDKGQCERGGGEWVGVNSSLGVCVPTTVAGKLSPRILAYNLYFDYVDDGVPMNSLPGWVAAEYSPFFPSVKFAQIRMGESSRVPGRSAMTDCYRIFWPSGSNMVTRISQNSLYDFQKRWLLHELAHVEQCEKEAGLGSLGLLAQLLDQRSKYALGWFRELPVAFVTSIIVDGEFPDADDIHDYMPMERAASDKADEVLTTLRNGGPLWCPKGAFFKSQYPDCVCPAGTRKLSLAGPVASCQ